jgi:hypothetical protein
VTATGARHEPHSSKNCRVFEKQSLTDSYFTEIKIENSSAITDLRRDSLPELTSIEFSHSLHSRYYKLIQQIVKLFYEISGYFFGS